jgi:hypothetical protein
MTYFLRCLATLLEASPHIWPDLGFDCSKDLTFLLSLSSINQVFSSNAISNSLATQT